MKTRSKDPATKSDEKIKRGYQTMPIQQKIAIKQQLTKFNLDEQAQEANIQQRTLKRWMKQEEIKKPGPKQQELLYSQMSDWYLAECAKLQRFPSRSSIQQKAIELSQNEEFTAGKTWIDKLMKHLRLREKAIKIFKIMGVNTRAIKRKEQYEQAKVKRVKTSPSDVLNPESSPKLEDII